MRKAIDQGKYSATAANIALRALTNGEAGTEDSVRYANLQRHLAYEMWDTAEIAQAALEECYALRDTHQS